MDQNDTVSAETDRSRRQHLRTARVEWDAFVPVKLGPYMWLYGFFCTLGGMIFGFGAGWFIWRH